MVLWLSAVSWTILLRTCTEVSTTSSDQHGRPH